MKKVLAIMAASLAMFWAQPSAAAIFTGTGDLLAPPGTTSGFVGSLAAGDP